MRPFEWCSRCQEIGYKEQYLWNMVRMFDVRIWFDKYGNPTIRHGLLTFDITDDELFDFFKWLDDKGDCYVRIILEETHVSKNKKNVWEIEWLFQRFCRTLKTLFKHIYFYGGNRKWDWKVLYDFGNDDLPLIHKYSSTATLFKYPNKPLAIIDDIYPKYYAKRFNHKNFCEYFVGDESKWLFFDFVNIR